MRSFSPYKLGVFILGLMVCGVFSWLSTDSFKLTLLFCLLYIFIYISTKRISIYIRSSGLRKLLNEISMRKSYGDIINYYRESPAINGWVKYKEKYFFSEVTVIDTGIYIKYGPGVSHVILWKNINFFKNIRDNYLQIEINEQKEFSVNADRLVVPWSFRMTKEMEKYCERPFLN